MLIGLISDTHGSARNFQKVLDGPFRNVELILHAGDVLHRTIGNRFVERPGTEGLADIMNRLPVPILIARGNCDSDFDQRHLNTPLMSPYVFSHIEGRRIMLLHGDGRKEEELEDMIARFRLDLIVHGHSHIARIKTAGSGLIVNPGTPTIPNPSSPFGRTVGILDTKASRVIIQEIETGRVVLEGAFG
jgi:putative phosphoesterase